MGIKRHGPSPKTGAIRPVLGFPGCFVDRGVRWLCDLKW
jgi:hypothetical protein